MLEEDLWLNSNRVGHIQDFVVTLMGWHTFFLHCSSLKSLILFDYIPLLWSGALWKRWSSYFYFLPPDDWWWGGEGWDRKQRDKLIKMTKYNFMFKSEEQKAVYELWYYLALKSNADVIKVFQCNVLSREIKTFFFRVRQYLSHTSNPGACSSFIWQLLWLYDIQSQGQEHSPK